MNYLDPFGEWLTATHNRMAEIAFNRSKEMIEDKLKLFEPNYKKIPMLIPCRISTLQANFKAGANAPDWGFDYDGLIENKGDHFHAMYLANIGSAYELKQLIINTTRINVAKAKKLFFETNKDN